MLAIEDQADTVHQAALSVVYCLPSATCDRSHKLSFSETVSGSKTMEKLSSLPLAPTYHCHAGVQRAEIHVQAAGPCISTGSNYLGEGSYKSWLPAWLDAGVTCMGGSGEPVNRLLPSSKDLLKAEVHVVRGRRRWEVMNTRLQALESLVPKALSRVSLRDMRGAGKGQNLTRWTRDNLCPLC